MTYSVTVTGGTPEEVYWDLAGLDNRFLGMIGKGATAYAKLVTANDADARRKLLISVTRYIDRQRWQGVANLAGPTVLAFPRDGLTLAGTAVDNATQLARVQKALAELVAIVIVKPGALSDPDTGSNLRAAGAGSARVEFFSPTSRQRGTATKFPTPVQDLLGQWLAAGGAGVQVSTGGSSASSSCSNFQGGNERRRDPL